MAYQRKSSFAAGELDPALHERTNLDKYQTGLATLRNAHIGKTGRIINRAGTRFILETKYPTKASVLTAPPFAPYLIEWGDQYVRIHTISYDSTGVALVGLYTEEAHDWLESDVPNIHFTYSGRFMYAFCEGKRMKKMVVGNLDISDPRLINRFVLDALLFNVPVAKTVSGPGGTGTGYDVDYVLSYVYKGEESITNKVAGYKQVINATEKNTVRLIWGTSVPPSTVSEIKVYRRPKAGNAYGFIGSSSEYKLVGADYVYDFDDIGYEADYTNSPPTQDFDALNANCKTGIVYQQRLILGDSANTEAIHASRPGLQNNFYRDYPVDSDSALTFKSGTSGNANVLRFLDSNALLAFTTAGIYASESGALTPDNLAMDKKGKWVINERVPPLEIPGGVLFVDKLTNTVRSLIYSNEAGGYPGEEVSIFSNHLFKNKTIFSWTFQDGDIPLVWVVFDDGTLISLTYLREHEMQAWSRHDSGNAKYESVTTISDTAAKGTAFFIVNRNGSRIIEATTDRSISDLKEYCGVDAALTWSRNLNGAAGGATINVFPQDPGDWAGLLTLGSNYSTWDITDVGDIYRFFDSQGSAVDLEVITYVDDSTVIVQPSVEFPGNESTAVQLWETSTTFGAAGFGYNQLNHMIGQKVSIMVDGYVIASPNNNIDNYDDIVVDSGLLTLPDGLRGAFVHIGLPYTSDVETLDVDTVEQKPTLLESKIVNGVFVKVYETRGIYVGSQFPANDVLTDEIDAGIVMEDPEVRNEEVDVGNAAQPLITTRYEIPISNDWDSNGRICIRQVDPLPFEILSIIPDLTLPQRRVCGHCKASKSL